MPEYGFQLSYVLLVNNALYLKAGHGIRQKLILSSFARLACSSEQILPPGCGFKKIKRNASNSTELQPVTKCYSDKCKYHETLEFYLNQILELNNKALIQLWVMQAICSLPGLVSVDFYVMKNDFVVVLLLLN